MSRVEQKVDLVTRLADFLAVDARDVLHRFRTERPDDAMYAFTFLAPAEGTWICCAIATEQTLDRVARRYEALGYSARSGDTLTELRRELRWANPDDGWYFYDFDDDAAILRELRQGFDSGAITMFDGTTEQIRLEALKKLDAEGAFGDANVRNRVTISFTYGEDPEDFMRYAEAVNPPEVLSRTRAEVADGLKASERSRHLTTDSAVPRLVRLIQLRA